MLLLKLGNNKSYCMQYSEKHFGYGFCVQNKPQKRMYVLYSYITKLRNKNIILIPVDREKIFRTVECSIIKKS